MSDESLLGQLAEEFTERVRAGELPDLIPDRTVRKEESSTTEQWSLAWPLLILFAALVTAEWILRKRWRLC